MTNDKTLSGRSRKALQFILDFELFSLHFGDRGGIQLRVPGLGSQGGLQGSMLGL